VLDNDTDSDGDTLTVASVNTRSTRGVVTVVNGTIQYEATEGAVGVDFLDYTVSDGRGGISDFTQVILILVPGDEEPVNEVPEMDSLSELFFAKDDGSLARWILQGSVQQPDSSCPLIPDNLGVAGWRVVAVTDLDADGSSDLIIQHEEGFLGVWFLDGSELGSASLLNPRRIDVAWSIIASGDFNGDGSADLLFKHESGLLAVWNMEGLNRISSEFLVPDSLGDAAWRVAVVTDLNADGEDDLVIQHDTG
jgi:hypothetical protein